MTQKSVVPNHVIFRCNTFETTLKKLKKENFGADGPQTGLKLLTHV